MDKIALVGAGRVGEAAAAVLAQKDIARELVLIGTQPGVARGTALDLAECVPLFGFDTRVRGSTEPDDLAGADLVVVSAGRPRKPGMSRSDVLDANAPLVAGIAARVGRIAPEAALIAVANPVDILTHVAWRASGLPRERVIGLSGTLDAARMAGFVAEESGLSHQDVRAPVVGGHGDNVAPWPCYTTISGIPLNAFLTQAAIDRVVARTRQGGAEILALKQTSSAHAAPGAAVSAMVDAIAHDRKRLLPCVAILVGEYGQRDVAMDVPVILGRTGIERIIALDPGPDEAEQVRQSAAAIRRDLDRLRVAA